MSELFADPLYISLIVQAVVVSGFCGGVARLKGRNVTKAMLFGLIPIVNGIVFILYVAAPSKS